ncbi:hypothetical protein TNCV_90321 [Trichonephila clavipes]|nr:hypothetical protein TNCV_90321 [Trichonephila clavipes]
MDEADNFPLAAPVVLSDCHMDDILSEFESIEEDDKGVMRVVGRLEKASILYSQKHPAILAKNSKLSKTYFITLH